MLKRNSVAATLLALTVSTTTLATAATVTAQPKAPVISTTSGGGEITSPGDPFRPQLRVPHVGTQTYSMSCGIGEGQFANGAFQMDLVNTSTKTIPKGAKIVVTYPDGSQETFVAWADIGPGGYLSKVAPSGATPENYKCSASASAQVAAGEAGPAESGAPTTNPAVPPKIVCWYEVVDGKVTIYFQNQGGSAVAAGLLINGHNAAGLGGSWWSGSPFEPGEINSFELDADPSLADTPCTGSFSANPYLGN